MAPASQKLKSTGTNQAASFSTLHISTPNAPIEGGGVIAIGDKIECRFLYDPNSEIIDPEKSGYIRIVDSGSAS